MDTLRKRLIICLSLATALLLLAIAAPAMAASGDYGVSTGASAASTDCGGRGLPACSMTYQGYTASFRTLSNGYAVYSFTFSCEILIGGDGSHSLVGTECSQYLSSSG